MPVRVTYYHPKKAKRSLLLSVPYILVWRRKLCLSSYLNPLTLKNDHTYGVGEFCHVMKDLTKKQRIHFMHQVMASPYNYVKKKDTTVYKVLNFHKLGHTYAFDKPWNDKGNKRILNDSQIDECVRLFAANSSEEKMTKGHVNELLVDKTASIIQGVPILSGRRISQSLPRGQTSCPSSSKVTPRPVIDELLNTRLLDQ